MAGPGDGLAARQMADGQAQHRHRHGDKRYEQANQANHGHGGAFLPVTCRPPLVSAEANPAVTKKVRFGLHHKYKRKGAVKPPFSKLVATRNLSK